MKKIKVEVKVIVRFSHHFFSQSKKKKERAMAKTSSQQDVVAFEPADFVLFALLGFIVLYILPRHLLHYYRGHGVEN